MIFVVFISIITFAVETLPNLSESTYLLLGKIDTICILVFIADYTLNTKRHGVKYLLSFYGVIDLLTFLPSILSVGIDLRTLKLIRIIRSAFTFQKAVTRTNQHNRLVRAIISIKGELAYFMAVIFTLLIFFAFGVYFFEGQEQPDVFRSFFDALWFSIVTMTTVGFGEIYPVSIGGKIITSLMSLLGLGVVAIPSGLIAGAIQSESNNIKAQ